MFYRIPNKLPNCEVAKYIKHSILQVKYRKDQISSWVIDNYPYPLTYLRSNDSVCLFYVKNDSLLYYYVGNTRSKGELNVMPLYNYLKKSYDLLRVNYSPPLSEIEDQVIIVKAPNGKLYGLTEKSNTIYIAKIVENEILYQKKLAYNDIGQSVWYSLPIANSFVVILEVNEREGILTIDIFDLVKENKYEIKYSIWKHKKFLLDQTLDNADFEQKNWLRSQLSSNSIDSFMEKIEYSLDKLNDNVVFYKKAVFILSFRYLGLYISATQKVYRFIRRSPVITVEYEWDKLIVNIETGTDGVIEIDTNILQIKPNITLENKEYKLNEEYRILNSHLYSVIESLGKYAIIKELKKPSIYQNRIESYWHIYQEGKLIHAITSNKCINITKLPDIRIIKIGDGWFAIITKMPIRRKYDIEDYVLYRNQYDLHLLDTTKLYEKLKNTNEYIIIINESDLVKKVDIIVEIEKSLSNSFGNSYEVELRNAAYYFDIKLRVIYVIVPVYTSAGDYVLVVFRKELNNSSINQKRHSSIWFFTHEWKGTYEIQSKVLLFCNGCFYYVSGLGDFERMSKSKILTQYGIIPIKLTRSAGEKNYYQVGYNRLSVPLHADCLDSEPIIHDMSIVLMLNR